MELVNFFVALFLLLPPTILCIKFWSGRPAWWVAIIAVAVLGWFFWLSAYVFYQLHIEELIALKAELPQGWDSDGAAGVFAIMFGWLLSLIYFLPWLAIYSLVSSIRRIFRRDSSKTAII